MSFRCLFAALAASACLAAAPAASAAVIAFDGFAGGSSWSEDGYTIATANGFFLVSNFGDSQPSMFPFRTNTVVEVTRDGGGAFDFVSVMLRELNGNVGAQTLTFTGTLAGGGTVSQTVTTDGVCCSGLSANDFEVFSFGSAFTNLLSVSWDQLAPEAVVAYDNFVLEATAVPAPAALGAFALGIAGLGVAGRRRNVQATAG
jgi:hypothetical protein